MEISYIVILLLLAVFAICPSLVQWVFSHKTKDTIAWREWQDAWEDEVPIYNKSYIDPTGGKSRMGDYWSTFNRQPRQTREQVNMLSEFKQYISQHRDFIFTLLLVAIVDQFFLAGTLKSRIQTILTGSLKRLEDSVNKDLDGDGKVG